MNERELYEHLVTQESLKNLIATVDKEANTECLRLALTSMALCRNKKYLEAKKLISKIKEKGCDSFSTSVYLEAKMLISIYDNGSLDKAEEIADQVLSINSKAAFAKIVKSQAALKRGDIQSGSDYILSIGEDYPNANWIYYTLVRLLVFAKEYKAAQKYTGKVEPIIRRILYYLLVNILLPHRLLWTIDFILIFWLGNVSSVLFVIFTLPLLAIVFYGIIKKDNLIYNSFLNFNLLLIIAFFLATGLNN